MSTRLAVTHGDRTGLGRCPISLYRLVTGDADPNELRLSARHTYDRVARAYDKHDWANARQTIEPLAVAYREVSELMPPTSTFGIEDADVAELARAARAKLLDVAGASFLVDFPDSLEKAFDVDVAIMPYPADCEGEAHAAQVRHGPFICIGQSNSWYRVNFALAHELGHVIHNDLESFDSVTSRRSDERWANAFAAELLLPEADMLSVDWASEFNEKVSEVLWTSEVSAEALSIRLSELNVDEPNTDALKSAGTERLLLNFVGAEELQTKARRYEARRMPPRLLKSQQEAFCAGRVTGKSLAWLLEVPFEEINRTWGAPPKNDVDDLIDAFGL